jgi:hypothetical protein
MKEAKQSPYKPIFRENLIYEGILSLQDITRIYTETKNLIGN